MNEFAILLMKKDQDNIITEEIATLDMDQEAEYINSLFVTTNGEKEQLNIQLTTKSGVEDWEYTAIFDYYEDDKVADGIKQIVKNEVKVSVCEEAFNPTWEYSFPMTEDIEGMEVLLKAIIQVHEDELKDVLLEIKDKEAEYL
ncbi:MAG: DUF6762 family protein [Proteocatella sp.]